MLGTFLFELWFKSYCLFTEWSLEFSEIAKRPFSPSPTPPALFSLLPTDSAARRRRGEASRPSQPLLRLALSPTRRPGAPPPPVASRWSPPAVPRAPPSPEAPAPPPPRRRGGEPAAEAAALSSRAPGHYKSPSKQIRSPFRLLLASRPQNTPPLHRERRRAPLRRCLAIPEPLRPNRPRK